MPTTTTHAKPMTARQQSVLDTIRVFRLETGLSPTLQEIADTQCVSKVTVFETLKALEAKGWITRDKHIARSIRLREVCPQCGRGD